MKKLGIVALAFAASIGLSAAAGEIDERRPADRDVVVSVENIAGKVIVTGWNRDEIEIRGILGEGTSGLEITGDRSEWNIEVDIDDWYEDRDEDWNDVDVDVEVEIKEDGKRRYKGRRHHHERTRSHSRHIEGTDLEIRIPRGASLEIETVSAEISIDGVEGDLEIESVSGEVRLRGAPRSVDVEVVSGNVDFVSSGVLEEGDFETVIGTVDVEADLARGGDFDFETVSGTITLRIDSGTSATFDIESFSGSIRNELGPEPRKTSQYLPSQELRFTLGGGGAHVSMESISGSLRIVRR